MVKRGTKLILALGILTILIIPLMSAGFFDDFYAKITGKSITNETSLNITIGNAAPTITFVEIISNIGPVEGANRSFEFNFTATDTDGFANIDTSTAEGRFQRSGEPTRLNTSCAVRENDGANNINFTCTIEHPYFDEVGSWTINVTIRDTNGASGENSSQSHTYNVLTAMTMFPLALSWSGVGVSSVNVEANENITINNTGNDIDLNINVTGLDLEGEDTTTEYIFADNFTVNDATQGSCTSTEMVNITSTNVTSSILQKGENALNNFDDTSGQEQIVFCLQGVVDTLSSQSYSSAAFGSWEIKIVT